MTKFNVAFMIKVVENAGPKETYLNTIKGMYEKPTANITLNGSMLGTVPLKSGPTQISTIHTPFQHHAQSPSWSKKAREGN